MSVAEVKNQCEALLEAITTPSEKVQFVVAGTSVPQVSSTPREVLELTFNGQGPNVSQYLPAGTMAVIVQRNPVWSVIFYDPNPNGLTGTYEAWVRNSQTTNVQFNFPDPSMSGYAGQYVPTSIPINIVQWGATTNWRPHGDVLYTCQTPDGFSWFPMDGFALNASTGAGANFIVLGITTADPVCSMRLWYWDPVANMKVMEDATQFGPGTSYLYPKHRGYYALELDLQNMGAGAPTISMTIQMVQNASDVMCHIPLPGWGSLNSVAGSLRILGASLLNSCVAPVLNKNGDVLVTQQSLTRPWPLVLNGITSMSNMLPSVTAKTSAQLYKIFNWEKGAHVFLKPEAGLSTLQQMEFSWNSNPASTGVLGTPSSLLVECPYTRHDYIMSLITTQTASASGIGRFTIDFWINFESMAPWLQGEVGKMPTMDVIACMDKIALAEQFHENWAHLAALATFVRTAGAALLSRLMPVVRSVGGYLADKLLSEDGKEVLTPTRKPPQIRQITNVAPRERQVVVMPRSRAHTPVKVPRRASSMKRERKKLTRMLRKAKKNANRQ